MAGAAVELIGDDVELPCVDGSKRRYVSLDAAASTGALPEVAARVHARHQRTVDTVGVWISQERHKWQQLNERARPAVS